MLVACRDEPEVSTPRTSPAVAVVAAVADLQSVEIEAGWGSEAPNLHLGVDGSVVISWLESTAGGHALRWQRRQGDRWSGADTAHQSGSMFVNWADVPAVIAAAPDRLVATWLEHHGQGHGYGISWSQRVGTRWAAPALLSDDRTGPEYGFVSFAAAPGQPLTVFWLDGRTAGGDHGQMQLRAAQIDAEGAVAERRLVDERVCDCCPTSAAATAKGPVVAYRDRSPEEVRDIMLAGPGRQQRRAVAADGWTIEGCPVNGPAVAVSDDRIAVAWFSAAAQRARVQVATASGDGPFSAPTVVDRGRPVGRVDLVWLDAQRLAVSWIEDGDEPSLLVRSVTSDGALGPVAVVTDVSAARASGMPRMARADGQLWWAWTEVSAQGATRVRLATAPVASVRSDSTQTHE